MRFCLHGADDNDKIEISVLEASEEVSNSSCDHDLTLTVNIDASWFHVNQATTSLDTVSTLKAFLSELENCYNTLDGEALFEDDSWGPDFWFRVKMERRGHACITGMAVYEKLYQLKLFYSIYRAFQEVGISVPIGYGGLCKQLAVAVYLKYYTAPFQKVIGLLQNAYVCAEILHPQRGDIKFHVGVGIGSVMKAYSLIKLLASYGNRMVTMRGVPAYLRVANVGIGQKLLVITKIDGIL